ncbi:hypothetical protein LCGC14_0276070 [marine sediment metagenome]|uniref:Uncharacterized protein n=1 Tax=marine sediment metagenome TaxID=412755 RepID=A0A0F9TXR8_9ZZZZ
MIGVRFYLDYVSAQRKRKGQHAGNVIAAHVITSGRSWSHVGTVSKGETGKILFSVECIAAVYASPNSPVCSSSVSRTYLQESCKFISEGKAREIHPALFERLDAANEEKGVPQQG